MLLYGFILSFVFSKRVTDAEWLSPKEWLTSLGYVNGNGKFEHICTGVLTDVDKAYEGRLVLTTRTCAILVNGTRHRAAMFFREESTSSFKRFFQPKPVEILHMYLYEGREGDITEVVPVLLKSAVPRKSLSLASRAQHQIQWDGLHTVRWQNENGVYAVRSQFIPPSDVTQNPSNKEMRYRFPEDQSWQVPNSLGSPIYNGPTNTLLGLLYQVSDGRNGAYVSIHEWQSGFGSFLARQDVLPVWKFRLP